MSRLLICASACMSFTVMEVQACDNSKTTLNLRKDRDYAIAVNYIDNRIRVAVNGQWVLDQTGNGPSTLKQNVSALMDPNKENTIEVAGYNAKYQGGHDPNPADIRYQLIQTTPQEQILVTFNCLGPDNRGTNEVQFFDHVYVVRLN